ARDRGVSGALEPVKHPVGILVDSRDHSPRVDASGDSSERARARASCPRNVELADRTVGGAHEAVIGKLRVRPAAGDHSARVDADGHRSLKFKSLNLSRVCASTGSVDNSERVIGETYEAMAHVIGIPVVSRNGSRRVNAEGLGTLSVAGACARSVESADRAVGGSHEAVIHQARVSVHSRDRPRRVYARWDGSRIEAQVRAWSIERSDRATGSAHEAVIHAVCVREHSRNNSSRIDADGEGSPILARARAGSIEKGNRAAGGVHEAVSYIATACED